MSRPRLPCRSPHNGGRVRRRPPGVLGMRAAAGALLVLTLSACGSDGTETFVPGDGPAAQTPADAPAASASADRREPGAESGPRAEIVQAAPGMRVVIEWPPGLSPEQQAMIKAYGDYYAQAWKAIATGGKDVSYGKTVEGPAERSAYEWVQSFVARANAAKGTVRVYGLRVAAVLGRGAEVDACVDRSGVQVTDAATGRPAAGQPAWTKGPRAVHFQAAGVRRGDDGTWRVANLRYAEHPDERAKECQR